MWTFNPWEILRGNWLTLDSSDGINKYTWNISFWVVLIGGIWFW